MQKEALEEFEYERSGVHIHLRKASARVLPGGPGLRRALAAKPAAAVPGAVGEGQDAGSTGDAHVIKSPIVGTFYAATRTLTYRAIC